MIDKIIAFSIRNKLIISLLVLGLIGWGISSLTRLPLDAVPDITNNQVQVITVSPTLAPQEVERLITYPVEVAMAPLPDVEEIRSVSRFGLSVVTIVFKEGVDVLDGRQLVGERLSIALQQIPSGIGTPEMSPITTGLGEVYQYIIQPEKGYEDKYSPMQLRTIQDWIVKRQLLGTDGVAEVSSYGGYLKQYEVAVNPRKLQSLNLSLPQVYEALEKNNENTGGAYIEKNENIWFIRGIGLMANKEDIENTVIATRNGIPVLTRHIGQIRQGYAVRYGALTRNASEEAVGGIVLMLKGENSYKVVKNVKERIAQIEQSLPEGLKIHAYLDRSDLIGRTISTVSQNLIEGALIVILILVLLLGNLRAGLIVASVIPLSLLFAIGMMNLFGISGNLMSLGAIDFGLIVDGAVIIVESIVHRLHAGRGDTILSRKQMDSEVYKASSGIRQSAAFGEIIILIVYLPIFALVGTEGKMFRPMAMTVGFAILGALLLSLTWVPMASAAFLSKKIRPRKNISDKIMEALYKIYRPLLDLCLRFKWQVLAFAVALFAISLVVFSRMGGEFVPTLEEGDFAVEVRLVPGSSLQQTIEVTQKASGLLLANFPEVKEVVGKIGTAEIPTDPMPIEACDLMIILKDKSEWVSAKEREELAAKMAETLELIPGVEFGFQQPIQMRFNELMTGARQDVAIKIYGDDLEVLARKAAETKNIIQETEGIGDIYVEKVQGMPQLIVEYQRDRAATYGVDIAMLNRIVRTALAGEKAGEVYEGEKRFDLVVRLDKDFREDIESIKNLYVPLEDGRQIPLTELADIRVEEGASQISRERAQRKILVGVNTRNRDVQSVVEDMKQKLGANLNLPAGYFIEYGGQFKNLQEGKERLMVAVPVALLLIFILLYLTFNNVKQSIMIFTAVPFAAVGGIFALLIRDMPFSISAGVGFIALFGVAVLNGIVLIASLNNYKKAGINNLHERVKLATRERLRPVIMTAAVASLGFLPMAVSGSAGAEVQKPLATVVIGGLVSSTLLTLLVLPVIYILWENSSFKTWKGGKMLLLISTMFLAFPGFSQAPAQDTINLTLDKALETAKKEYPALEAASQQISRQKHLKKGTFNPGKTNIEFGYGQFDSFMNDNYFRVSQDFLLPNVYRTQSKAAEAYTESARLNYELVERQIERNVKDAFYDLMVAKQKLRVYEQLDSIYMEFERAATVRYQRGESPYIEQVAATSRLLEVRNKRLLAAAEMEMAATRLEKLMVTESYIQPVADSLQYQPASEENIEQHPLLALRKNRIEAEKMNLALERGRLYPSVSAAFTSQTLQGTHEINGVPRTAGPDTRFNYVSLGLSVPLWYRQYTTRISAAEAGVQAEAAVYETVELQLSSQYEQTLQRYLQLRELVQFYKTQGLIQAELLVELSHKAYKAGEAGYIEFLRNMDQAAAIRLGYLEALELYNNTAINLEYLAGPSK